MSSKSNGSKASVFGVYLFVFYQQYIQKRAQYNKITANSRGKKPKTQSLYKLVIMSGLYYCSII